MTSHAERVRVVFAIPELDHGGPDRVVFELLTALDRQRFEPILMVSKRDGYYLSRLPSDVPVELVEGASAFGQRYPVVGAIRAIRRISPDVVLATQRMSFTMGIAAAGFPRRTRLLLRQSNDVSTNFAALIGTSRLKHRVARQLAILTLQRAHAVICQSHAMQRDLRGLLGAQSALHVIHNPIDIARASRESAEPVNAPPGRPSLVSVGRLSAQKGHDVLLHAMAIVKQRHPGVHLTIHGEGPERAALEHLRRALDLETHVTFAGHTTRPLRHVRASDLFVLASRFEGFPNAALEALAVGTPVVLTDCPGANAEIVVAGVNGKLAPAVAPSSMATAIQDAIDELSSYTRTRITDDCDARFGSSRIVRAYEDLIASSVTGRVQQPAASRRDLSS